MGRGRPRRPHLEDPRRGPRRRRWWRLRAGLRLLLRSRANVTAAAPTSCNHRNHLALLGQWPMLKMVAARGSAVVDTMPVPVPPRQREGHRESRTGANAGAMDFSHLEEMMQKNCLGAQLLANNTPWQIHERSSNSDRQSSKVAAFQGLHPGAAQSRAQDVEEENEVQASTEHG